MNKITEENCLYCQSGKESCVCAKHSSTGMGYVIKCPVCLAIAVGNYRGMMTSEKNIKMINKKVFKEIKKKMCPRHKKFKFFVCRRPKK